MGFRRLQKAQSKRRSKEKIEFNPEPQRAWKKTEKSFRKYKKIRWSGEDHAIGA